MENDGGGASEVLGSRVVSREMLLVCEGWEIEKERRGDGVIGVYGRGGLHRMVGIRGEGMGKWELLKGVSLAYNEFMLQHFSSLTGSEREGE